MRKQTEQEAVEIILPMHVDVVPQRPRCACCGEDQQPVSPVSYAFVWDGGELSETNTDLLCAECIVGAPARIVIFAVHSVLTRNPMQRGIIS